MAYETVGQTAGAAFVGLALGGAALVLAARAGGRHAAWLIERHVEAWPALALLILPALVLPLIWVTLRGLTEADAFYDAATQRRIVAVLVATSVAHAAWGWWADRGGGGLHTLLVLALAYAGLWWAGLRIELVRLPGGGAEATMLNPTTSFAVTLLWLLTVSAVVEWTDRRPRLAAGFGAAIGAGVALFVALRSPGDLFVLAVASALAVAAVAGCLADGTGRPPLALGKSGALLLGHWVAVLTVLARLKGPAAGLLAPVGLVALIAFMLLFRFLERSLRWSDVAAPPPAAHSSG